MLSSHYSGSCASYSSVKSYIYIYKDLRFQGLRWFSGFEVKGLATKKTVEGIVEGDETVPYHDCDRAYAALHLSKL